MAENETEARLIAEHLAHALDIQKMQMEAIKEQIQHEAELNGLKYDHQKKWLEEIEKKQCDQETRMRKVEEGVTQSKYFLGLMGGTVLLALASLIKSFFFT